MQSQIITPYYAKYKYLDEDGDTYIKYYSNGFEMMEDVCKAIAFSDCSGIEFIEIVADSKKIRYYGWLPDMEMRFVNVEDPNEIMWDSFYPEFDH